ncbi:copper chaperone PCu(A)C [Swaminathania salitolerans]|uniref:copper chaperone PCu(A)C n=1 Tax=Swaminathania salitolerans TaxID=182838 RepID=UPI001FE6A693|nr:copper chaperone PCu(A)C [Swaminathania salitolerans]GBQ15217.1 hypothetical protein AA21291_2096 [Swaminathania salitolerans LMG 21291]
MQAILALSLAVCVAAPFAAASQAFAQTTDADIPGQKNASHDITIDGWMRRSKHIHGLAAAYFTIRNTSSEPHLISGVSSTDCTDIDAYHSEQEMNERTASLFSHFTIPGNMTMVFPEGGYHLICKDFPDSVKPGDSVPITFSFLGGSRKTVTFKLRDRS